MPNNPIELSYTLYPPPSVQPPIAGPSSQPIPSSSKSSYPVPPSHETANKDSQIILPPTLNKSTTATSEYYESLTYQIRELQLNLNETLTHWKDAVGDLEKHKEDSGKVPHGKGRATVMSLAVNGDFKDQREGYKNGLGQAEESDSDEESESE